MTSLHIRKAANTRDTNTVLTKKSDRSDSLEEKSLYHGTIKITVDFINYNIIYHERISYVVIPFFYLMF